MDDITYDGLFASYKETMETLNIINEIGETWHGIPWDKLETCLNKKYLLSE